VAIKLSQKGDGVYELDVKGYACPHPQLYTLKSLEKIPAGNVLEVVFDNPSSNENICIAVEKKGYKILETTSNGGVFTVKIEKKT
jgi:tRNA 2-thiouridine synthesizing protein A